MYETVQDLLDMVCGVPDLMSSETESYKSSADGSPDVKRAAPTQKTHRRQDSMLESIFALETTSELRLEDFY